MAPGRKHGRAGTANYRPGRWCAWHQQGEAVGNVLCSMAASKEGGKMVWAGRLTGMSRLGVLGAPTLRPTLAHMAHAR
jgi:hypothetical protein